MANQVREDLEPEPSILAVSKLQATPPMAKKKIIKKQARIHDRLREVSVDEQEHKLKHQA